MIAVLLLCAVATFALDNGVARTPPMGWLSWEAFRCETDCTNFPDTCISANLYMAMADHLVSDGYAAVGYEYVNIDDCWSSMTRSANGSMVPDPVRFPNGISGLADYVHSKGLKLGLYSDIGTYSCGGYPGMAGHFQQDVETFASWGIDSLKVDGCYADWQTMNQSYPQLSEVILQTTNTTGHPIMFSCSWPAYVEGNGPIQYQAMAKYCNLWRNYDDIQDNWDSVSGIIEFWGSANGADYENFVHVARPGAWNDPDQIIIGNTPFTITQEQTQMAFWALFAAPLLMSNDLRNMTIGSQAILQNTEVIAVNQDPLGRQGRRISSVGGLEVWTRWLADYSAAVILYNSNNSGAAAITVDFETIGFSNITQLLVRDLFQHEDLGIFTFSFTGNNIPANGVQMLQVSLAD